MKSHSNLLEDTLLASGGKSWSWPYPMDIKLSLVFSGIGNFLVTYTEVNYKQVIASN